MQRTSFLLNIPADLLKSGSNKKFVQVSATKHEEGNIQAVFYPTPGLLNDLISIRLLSDLAEERANCYFPAPSTSFVDQKGVLCLQS